MTEKVASVDRYVASGAKSVLFIASSLTEKGSCHGARNYHSSKYRRL
jgi:hypothetical protein